MILPLRYHGLAPRGYYHAPQLGLHKVGRTFWFFNSAAIFVIPGPPSCPA